MSSLLLVYPGQETLGKALAEALDIPCATLELHRFPDGEARVTVPEPAGRQVLLLCSLDQPDAKLAPLLFAADAARELGAPRVGLVAPYLAYMRQDRRFKPGEAISSRTFAALISQHFDFLVTVDPHLHRYHSLNEIYTIPSQVVPSAPVIARWLAREVAQAVLIGPDEESRQWVAAIAELAGLPHTVLSKIRHDDFHVDVSLPDAAQWAGHTAVLVDDIVSSARTMMAAVHGLQTQGFAAPVCVGVHAIFAGDAYAALQAAGAGRIVSCNTVSHASNGIDLMPAVAEALAGFLNEQA